MEPDLNLIEKPDPERPIFVQMDPLETTQVLETYAHKQRLVQRKDLGRIYSTIYEEKVNQQWRFSRLDVSKGEDPDDENYEDTEEMNDEVDEDETQMMDVD